MWLASAGDAWTTTSALAAWRDLGSIRLEAFRGECWPVTWGFVGIDLNASGGLGTLLPSRDSTMGGNEISTIMYKEVPGECVIMMSLRDLNKF